MSRTRRVSRGLVAATAVVLALGLVFWLHKVSTRPRAANASAAGDIAAPALEAKPATAPVAAAPSALAATQPAPLALVTPNGATTRPAQPEAPPRNSSVIVSGPPLLAAVGTAPKNPTATPTVALSTQPLVDAKARVDAGRLLDARRILNASIAGGQLSAADLASAKQLLNTINATIVLSPRRFADDEYAGIYTVQRGDRLQKIANNYDVTVDLLCRINGITDPRRMREGQALKVLHGPFHAIVDKKNFTLEMYLGAAPGEKGSIYVASFPVGLGKDDSTPSGVWMVEPHNKVKKPTYYSPRGQGKIDADDPANPLGGYWIGLTGVDGHAIGKTSYGIHGTIHPETIGKQESMGCIRLKNEDVALVFEMLVEGKSTVVVKD